MITNICSQICSNKKRKERMQMGSCEIYKGTCFVDMMAYICYNMTLYAFQQAKVCTHDGSGGVLAFEASGAVIPRSRGDRSAELPVSPLQDTT